MRPAQAFLAVLVLLLPGAGAAREGARVESASGGGDGPGWVSLALELPPGARAELAMAPAGGAGALQYGAFFDFGGGVTFQQAVTLPDDRSGTFVHARPPGAEPVRMEIVGDARDAGGVGAVATWNPNTVSLRVVLLLWVAGEDVPGRAWTLLTEGGVVVHDVEEGDGAFFAGTRDMALARLQRGDRWGGGATLAVAGEHVHRAEKPLFAAFAPSHAKGLCAAPACASPTVASALAAQAPGEPPRVAGPGEAILLAGAPPGVHRFAALLALDAFGPSPHEACAATRACETRQGFDDVLLSGVEPTLASF